MPTIVLDGRSRAIRKTGTAISLSAVVLLAGCGGEEGVHQGYSETAAEYEVDGKIISNVDVQAPLWNPRGKTPEQIAERVRFLTDAYDIERTDAQKARAATAREKYADAIVINSLMPAAVGIVDTTADDYRMAVTRNADAGMTAASGTVYSFPGDGESTVFQRIDETTEVLNELGIKVLSSVEDIRQAKRDGTMVVMFNVQGSDFVIDDMSAVEEVAEGGVRVANFVYNLDNDLAGGGTAQDKGVTELGREFIAAANANNIVVDCSHSSNQTCIDAAKYSTTPVIASHSNPAAVFDINRNISDEAMQAIAASGGVVCSTGVGTFMNPEFDASPERYAEHIEYTANLIGRDRTCFSTDYLPNAEAFFADSVANVDIYPPEKGFGVPASNMAAEHVWDTVAALEDNYEWSEEDVIGFLGENLLKVYQTTWGG